MALRIGTTRIIVFLFALAPGLFMAAFGVGALLFPLPERDAEGHPLCPPSSKMVAADELTMSAALLCLAAAVLWPGQLSVWRRLLLIGGAVVIGLIGARIHPTGLVC